MNTKMLIMGILSLASLFQQEEPLSKVANIKVPDNAQRIAVESVESKLAKEYKYGRRAVSGMKHIYETQGIIVAFNDLVTGTGFKNLEERRTSELGTINEMGGEIASGVDESKIITLNTIKFYILKRHVKDEYFYTFVSESNDSKGIYGSVTFKKERKENAEKIFDRLIKSISFKKERKIVLN